MKLTVLICLIVFALRGSAQTSPDSSVVMRFRIFYPVGAVELHEDYMDNAKNLYRIRKYLEKSPQIDSVTIYSSASPEGSYQLNKRLAAERGKTAKQYLLDHLPADRHLSDSIFIIDPTAENWQGLRDMVYYQYTQSDRDEILAILDRNDITDERRKVLLKRLNGGRTWRYILKNIMPTLRYATWVTVWQRIREERIVEKELISLKVERPELLLPKFEPIPLPPPVIEEKEEYLSVLALKTNLLYDALLSPSIEVEYRFASHWSAHVDFAIAWWKNDPKHQYYQLAQLSPEMRYWFNGKEMWKGHYIATFLGAGHYDLENGGRGYQGEFMMAGLSYGYMFPISRTLSLEAAIGVGYMHTDYREYLPLHGHYVYQLTGRTGYVGPLKAKFSLVWRLPCKKKGGDQ